MWFFYTFSCLILVIGLILFIKNKQIAIGEWLLSAFVAFMVSGIFHAIAFNGMTADEEVWSGKIIMAKQFSAWQEYYEEAVYRTEYYDEEETYYDEDGEEQTRTVRKSKEVFDHWEPETRWHDEYFMLDSDIGTQYRVEKNEYLDVVRQFDNNTKSVEGDRTTSEHASKMIGGDPNDYETTPDNGATVPVVAQKSFVNRIKAAPTVFSYGKVDPQEPVYEYPFISNWRKSNRLLGIANQHVGQRLWDEMNARLGPKKQVNVIMVGFTNMSIGVGITQESKWVGGKKNDMVICYGVSDSTNKADWVHVFSWSEREDCKINLKDIILQNPIDNNIIPLIESELASNFVRKDWKKFDYLSISPSTQYYWYYFVALLLTQIIIWSINFTNDFVKNSRGF